MQSTVEFTVILDAAGSHGHEWTLHIKKVGDAVAVTLRNQAGAVQCHGQERRADFQKMAQLLAQ